MKEMKVVRFLVLAIAVAMVGLIPLHEANAGDRDGYRGGDRSYRGDGNRSGYHGGHRGYRSGRHGYRGGYRYRGYRGYSGGDVAAGLAIGTIVGAAIANSNRPPVVVAPPPPPPVGCQSVFVNGAYYYNCNGQYSQPYSGGYNGYQY